ncbi:MAG: aminopeptidase [Deltaproteobacteria bacterium]|nr:aminopeptidase [Deltaproteobacteria bacterium]MBZ0219305.1 aminopeptidase [Deltaproteobacteria bacterium]
MPDNAIEKIFTVNLGVKKDEKVLVFTDLLEDPDTVPPEERKKREALVPLAKEVAEIGSALCKTSYLEFPAVGSHGKEPPKSLWEAAFGSAAVSELEKRGTLEKILRKEAAARDLSEAEGVIRELAESPDAIIALSNYSTSHTRFRDFLTRIKGVRYASMPLFEREMLAGAMTADWKEVERRTKRLVRMISGADTAVITSHNGTSISFSIKGRDALPDTGILIERGSFSNLPAGEAFLAPVEGTAEGVLILEWAPTGRLHKPVELVVKKGTVVEVVGNDNFSRKLRERIEANPLCGNIAELGIGTNEKASRPDNILETEKILGTVHIALGDNSSFGGKVSVPFHQDFIFFRPSFEVIKGEEKIEVLIEGEPRFEAEGIR